MRGTLWQVLAALLVFQWLGLCCANSLTGGLYRQPLNVDTAGSLILTDWSTTVAFSGLVLYPLLCHNYAVQVHVVASTNAVTSKLQQLIHV